MVNFVPSGGKLNYIAQRRARPAKIKA